MFNQVIIVSTKNLFCSFAVNARNKIRISYATMLFPYRVLYYTCIVVVGSTLHITINKFCYPYVHVLYICC